MFSLKLRHGPGRIAFKAPAWDSIAQELQKHLIAGHEKLS